MPVGREHAREAPEAGPRILFLSGGSALRAFCHTLTRHTHNSVHLVTPFDSGGSSASLRAAFDMLAVGDLRNRLLALADDRESEAEPIRRALHARLDRGSTNALLRERLARLVAGLDPLTSDIPAPQRRRLCVSLGRFARRAPADFDLRGASLGNLVLVGAYLESRDIEAALSDFAALVRVRGRVLPTVDANLHLAARLADGSEVVGQHKLSGKEHPPLASAIAELRLVQLGSDGQPRTVLPAASTEAIREIRAADLICYPMGSFYSSVLCNTLPRGIGRAIQAAACPKVYVPSTGQDPELLDADPGRAAEMLIAALRRDAGSVPATQLLGCVLLDQSPDVYARAPDLERLDGLGVERISCELVTASSRPEIDPDRLARALLSLATREQVTTTATRAPG